jgi:hypothetical protein
VQILQRRKILYWLEDDNPISGSPISTLATDWAHLGIITVNGVFVTWCETKNKVVFLYKSGW